MTVEAAPKTQKASLYLECRLTDDEMKSCSKTLAESIRQRDQLLADIETFKAQRKAEIVALDGTIAKMSSMVNSEKEFRDVRCEVIFNFEKGFKTYVRLDTGEEVKHDPITDAERQAEFNL